MLIEWTEAESTAGQGDGQGDGEGGSEGGGGRSWELEGKGRGEAAHVVH